MKRIALVLGICLMASAAHAQNGYVRMPLNISLYKNYSLGHMIAGNRRIINHLSVNIITGRAAQLQGIEVGGIANIYSESVYGIQVAGLANAVDGGGVAIQAAGLANVVNDDFLGIQASLLANVGGGSVTGAQWSWLANVSERDFGGLQWAGLANVAGNGAWGFQGAGLANVVEGGMNGFQGGGLANVVEDDMNGFQAAGLANVVDGKLNGIQLSGLANMVEDDFMGLQASGLANVVDGGVSGIQLSGLVNVVNGDASVLQSSALANVVDGRLSGIQHSGLVNVAGGGMSGIQLAGLVNVADAGISGLQAAGLVNVSDDTRGGIQAAGLANVMEQGSYTLQAAGLLNVANNPYRSILIAPVNASDDDDILPLGLVSLVTGVPTWYDVWAEATGFVNAGFRSGTDLVHNYLFVGIRPADPFRWALGWGAGIHHDMGRDYYLEADAAVRHINVDEFWTDGRNTQATFRVLGGWRVSDRISLYAGPTFDYYTSNIEDGSGIASWSSSESLNNGTWERTWPGITAGIRFERAITDAGEILENFFDFDDIFSF